MENSDLLIAEIFERSVRLFGLVSRSTRHLEATGRKISAQIASAQRIKELLQTLVIDELCAIDLSSEPQGAKVDQLLALMEVVAMFHEGTLPTVPRIIEPIELHSYLRQGGVSDSIAQKRTLVFAAERLGMQVYPNGLAGLLVQLAARHKLEAKARHYSADISAFAIATLQERIDPYHSASSTEDQAYVAIPAIDIHNPTRWPSLWHELAHNQLQKDSDSLIRRFKRFVDGDSASSDAFERLCIHTYMIAIDPEDRRRELTPEVSQLAMQDGQRLIAEWLRECWCDAFGVRQAGLGFLYSQLHDFMFSWPSYLAKNFALGQPYPPAWLRLRLSRNLAIERLRHQANKPDQGLVGKLVDDYEAEENLFLSLNPPKAEVEKFKNRFADIYSYFLAFLKQDVFASHPDVLKGDISGAAFEELEDDLRAGLPIPAIIDRASGISRAAQVSEIILAGWRTRNERLRLALLTEFREYRDQKIDAAKCIQVALGLVDRADDSMKRSIQVAEWFSILSGADPEEEQRAPACDATHPEYSALDLPVGLLSETAINQLLFPAKPGKPSMRIVPLIDRRQQINGTAIDLRLGHNFELFQSIGQHAIDPCDIKSDNRVDSLEVEVDFLEGFPLMPGQFVLGHTLEYIKLPTDIAAQIEGRSSFARLGIQVHMTANLVDAGFEGCLTLEIKNNGPSTVVLYPGMRFAQLRLFKLNSASKQGYGTRGAKYHGQLGQNKAKLLADREVNIFRSHRSNGIS